MQKVSHGHHSNETSDVVYFGDDDNIYDTHAVVWRGTGGDS